MGQFKALSVKNWILFKRGPIGATFEIILPILFALFLILVRHLVTIETYQQHQYLADIKYVFSHAGDPIVANSTPGSTSRSALKNCAPGQIVALVPTGDLFVTEIKSIFQDQGYTVTQYTNDGEVDAIIRDQNYGQTVPKFCFGVSFQNSGSNYKYYLRFNVSNSDYSESPSPNSDLTTDEAINIGAYYGPFGSGMISVTTIVNNIILRQELSNTTYMLVNKEGLIYQQKFVNDSLYRNLANSIQFMFLLPLLIVYLRQTSSMLYEKEKKIRESMAISGMNLGIYYATWFIRYLATYLVIHLVISAIITGVCPKIPFYIPLVVFVLFDILLIIQSFFIQIFVTRAKIGIIIALLFFILQYVINYIVANNQDVTVNIYRAISIVPHIALILAIKEMIYAQSVQTVLTFTAQLNNYTIVTAIVSIVLNILFWGVLAWYLDQVFPNEWGAKKHPCFCCCGDNGDHSAVYQAADKGGSASVRPSHCEGTISQMEKDPQIESVQGKYKEMQKNKNVITIQNLNKIFNGGETHAVKDLSMTMYSDQIFVLLGHNGAGKTTTISMLTGMIKPTSGLIQVLGATQLSEIRQKIGVCPQHDTIYEDLTVEEHIRLFATFRGLSGDELQEQVQKLVKDVNLEEKKNEYSKNLSGGQKRRLSVAMAFSGGSKVIILDEPTSGMDTSARRYIWQMLKNYKSNRIILLTTHFMDQADYLGDRIAIMAGGKLVALGSNVYLKNKFGVGYNITFVKKNIDIPSQPIINCVMRHVNSALVLSNVSSQIAMQLPMDKVGQFSKLFAQIDGKKQQLGIETYGISITTLEQVFLKVGQQQQKKQNQMGNSNGFSNAFSNTSPQKAQLQMQIINLSRSPQKSKIENNDSVYDEENWQREDGCCERFVSHFLATILKRLRVIKRDLKSFIFELILPMIIIILALLLMRVSFIKDLPSQTLTYQLYKPQGTPILVPISAANPADAAAFKNEITGVYGDLLNVQVFTHANDLSFDSSDLFDLKKKYKTLKGGIFFEPTNIVSNITLVPFTSIVNTRSPTSVITVQTLAAQAYINRLSGGSNIKITPITKPFPRTFRQLRLNNAISGFFGSLIFSIALAFKFASIVSFIVKEREDKSKHQQIVSGMNVASYWLGNYLYDFILYLIVAIFSVVMCRVLKIQSLINGSAFTATCLIFLFFGLANIPFTYILGYLFKDYGNAQGVIYFFNFVSGGIVTIIILILRWISDGSNKVSRGLAWPLRMIPSFSFGEGLINMGTITLISGIENKGKDMAIFSIQIALAPLIFLIVFGCLYVTLMFVFQWLQNNESFMRFFTAQRSYDETKPIEDSDVLEEQKRAIAADPSQYEILTKKLRKVYTLDSDQKYKVAVDDLSFGVKKGEVFGLLGVNGAGKTTTFKMLAGQIVSTSGESFLVGLKISENLAVIRKSLGYCPQFDALIENLTVKEQLQLFYDMKCLPKRYKQLAIERKIKEMNLEQYRDKLSGTLSGGNKRKLSVAMAMIGNPNIIFLDEPSTGMDPRARRFMWKVISRISTQRKQSTVILTTHSMQQAQALSTRLGIMVSGNFKCIGTPQQIKSKYGKGFEIQIKLKNVKRDQVQKIRADNKLEKVPIINKADLDRFFQIMKVSDATKIQITKQGSGSYIWLQLEHKNKCSVTQLIQFLTIQARVQKISAVLKQSLGQVQILEHFQTYVRFKTNQNVSVGKMFEFLQIKKNQLSIMQYSIKQATVQQIFNKFAQEEGAAMD